MRDNYSDPNGSIYLTYGPVENWCFEPGVMTSLGMMFYDTDFNEDIGGWDVSAVTYFSDAFSHNSVFNQDISGWDVSSGGTGGGEMSVSKVSTLISVVVEVAGSSPKSHAPSVFIVHV